MTKAAIQSEISFIKGIIDLLEHDIDTLERIRDNFNECGLTGGVYKAGATIIRAAIYFKKTGRQTKNLQRYFKRLLKAEAEFEQRAN